MKLVAAILILFSCPTVAFAECTVLNSDADCNDYNCELDISTKFDSFDLPGEKRMLIDVTFNYFENRILDGEESTDSRDFQHRKFAATIDALEYKTGEADFEFKFTLPRGIGAGYYTGIDSISVRNIHCWAHISD